MMNQMDGWMGNWSNGWMWVWPAIGILLVAFLLFAMVKLWKK